MFAAKKEHWEKSSTSDSPNSLGQGGKGFKTLAGVFYAAEGMLHQKLWKIKTPKPGPFQWTGEANF